MGRRVYFGAVVLVVMALRQNRPGGASSAELEDMFGISKKTLLRWIIYFREEFPVSTKWQQLRGRVHSSVSNRGLPGNLLAYFINNRDSPAEGLVAYLRFLASDVSTWRSSKLME